MMPGVRALVLDSGALIAFERRDREAEVLIQRARQRAAPIFIPAGVVAEVWRDGARQARLAAILGSRNVSITDLTAEGAKAAGELCGRRRTSDPIDASVVLLARHADAVIATSDPDDLRALDPGVDLVQI
jgi:hypothetical protein